MKKLIALLLALVMVLSLVACGGTETPETDPATEPAADAPVDTPTETEAAGVSFTVVVADLDGSETTFNYTSDAETVGAALLQEGLIAGEDSDWGLMVHTVNGITADWSTECAYWAFYINGEYAQTGVDSTELVDGATYRFEKTVSYTPLGEGASTVYVTVEDVDGTVAKFQVSTDAQTVGEALLAVELIAGEDSDWGLMVTTVNGITADWDAEQAYWAFYIDGEYAQTGVDSTELTDGASYAFVKTISEG